MTIRPLTLTLLGLLALLAGCDQTPPSGAAAGPAAPASGPELLRQLDWDDLIPADWQPEKLLADYDVNSLADDDPAAIELMDKLRALWAEAPVVPALDGLQVRLPGFVVPLDYEATAISEFLLVPYFGACIHVPPPPPNQTIRVVTVADQPYQGGLFDTVWVEGRLHVDRFQNDLGDAAYRIDGARVSPYLER